MHPLHQSNEQVKLLDRCSYKQQRYYTYFLMFSLINAKFQVILVIQNFHDMPPIINAVQGSRGVYKKLV